MRGHANKSHRAHCHAISVTTWSERLSANREKPSTDDDSFPHFHVHRSMTAHCEHRLRSHPRADIPSSVVLQSLMRNPHRSPGRRTLLRLRGRGGRSHPTSGPPRVEPRGSIAKSRAAERRGRLRAWIPFFGWHSCGCQISRESIGCQLRGMDARGVPCVTWIFTEIADYRSDDSWMCAWRSVGEEFVSVLCDAGHPRGSPQGALNFPIAA
jgi:hypothetical protein